MKKSTSDIFVAANPLLFSTQLLNEIPIQIGFYFGNIADVTPKKLRKYLFHSQGWQLSSQGNTFLKMLYKHYYCRATNPIELTGKIILGLDRISSPWYVRAKDIIVFDQNTYFELQMLEGDLARFVDFK